MTRVLFQSAIWLLALMMSSVTLFAQADRGIITGLVLDSQGAAIEGVTIQVTNRDTSLMTTVVSSAGGNYATPPLIIGAYDLRVQLPGFKAFTATGIRLDSGQTFRQDVVMEIGDVNQSVEVQASGTALNEVNSEVSAAVDQRYYQDLPAVVSTEMRLPENMLYVVPGFVSLKPSNSFPAGTQFRSRMNGGQRAAFESYLDGASYGEVSSHGQTQERSAPFESIQEMRVIENTFSAQYGHTSGGFVEYTTKSGTSQLHGTLYEYLQNNALNARGEVAVRPPILRQNSYGAAVGGPVYIPKVYDGRQKTFFFFNFDQMKMRQASFNSFLTIPNEQFRQGDFSQLLGSSVGTDACGRAVLAGQIFDPATTRDASACGGPAGVPVRDAFPNNLVPLRSQVGRNINALFPNTDRAGILANYRQESRDRFLEPRTMLVRIDHALTDNLRLASTFNYNDRPRQTDCDSVGGCSVTTPLSRSMVQRISTKLEHVQITWAPKPNFYTHAVISYDRWGIPSTGDFQGEGWASKIGITGLMDADAGGFPGISFDQRYAALGKPTGRAARYTDRYQFLDDTTVLIGRHTLKAGIEFRREMFAIPEQGAVAGNWGFSFRHTAAFSATGAPINNTGDPYASLLLGQVNSATFDILANPYYRRNYWAPWINDDIKVTQKLTLSFGLRLDFQNPRTEAHNRYSTFNPDIPNPQAGGRLGALEFAGQNGRRTFEKTDTSTWGPRFSFAYRATDTFVIRGGYGIYYAPVVMDQNGRPILGFSSTPLANDLTNGRQPAFFLDNGFPQSAIRIPPFVDPSFANGNSVIWVKDDTLRLPRYQNWTLSLQKQLRDNLLLEGAYIANRGTRLIAGQFLSGENQNDPAILSRYPVSLLTSSITSPQAAAAGIPPPYAGFTGTVAQALRPYPQYQTITAQNGANGQSTYHSMQLRLDKRFSGGLQFRVAYTFSKLMNNGAESGISESLEPPQSVYMSENSLSSDHVPHAAIFAYTYELPFGRGKPLANVDGFWNHLVGGWNVSGVQRYNSGRPLSIVINNIYSGVLFNTALRPDRVPDVSGYGNNDNSSFDIVNDRYLSPAGWQMPPPTRLGNASRTDPVIRGWASYTEDVSLFKNVVFRESLSLRTGANFANLFNRHQWCDPNTNLTDTVNFGLVSGQCDVPRRIELYMKFTF